MAIRIKARSGETVEQMMRRFKQVCEKEGLTKDIKRKEFYEKPSERNRRSMRKSIARRAREAMGLTGAPMDGQRGGPRGGPGAKGPGGPRRGPGGGGGRGRP